MFEWTDKQQTAFDYLKEKLANPPVLAYADYHLPFKLHTDASNTGLGAVLYQNQGGFDRVIACASRSLKPAEKIPRPQVGISFAQMDCHRKAPRLSVRDKV